jgi:hypothetical protein
MFSHRRSCYCAFCKTPRKVYKSKNLSIFEVLALIFLSVLITHVVFRSFDPRGLGIIAVFLLVGEIFTQLKWRTTIACQNCGFDPVLYIRDQEQAGLKIKAFLATRGDSAAHLLRPPVKLPRATAMTPVSYAKPSAPSKNLSLKV